MYNFWNLCVANAGTRVCVSYAGFRAILAVFCKTRLPDEKVLGDGYIDDNTPKEIG